MAINDGGPAFPRSGFEIDRRLPSDTDTMPQDGMLLRDYFAAKAMPTAWQMECERPTGPYLEHMEPTYAGAAQRAYFFADAMLKAREAK